jgi:hypothetical protein
LKAVAYSKHGDPILCYSLYLLHYGTMGSDYAGAEPVAKCKATWDYYRVIMTNMIPIVPNKFSLDTYYLAHDMVNIAVTVAAGENSDSDSYCHYFGRKACKNFY